MFYVIHPDSWSTGNVREFCSQWTLLSYDRINPTTHVVAVSLKKDTLDTSNLSFLPSLNSTLFSFVVLTKMRANDKNLTITPYHEYHQLDSSQLKVKEPNHLFDVDPNNRRSNKRVYVDRDTAAVSPLNHSFHFSIDCFCRRRMHHQNRLYKQRKFRMNQPSLKNPVQHLNN